MQRESFTCPFLSSEVDLTEERQAHIADNHPDLLPEHRDHIARTLADPDRVCRSQRFTNALLFARWYDGLRGGKHVVVVVMTGGGPSIRNWVITAYLTKRLAEGDIVWARS